MEAAIAIILPSRFRPSLRRLSKGNDAARQPGGPIALGQSNNRIAGGKADPIVKPNDERFWIVASGSAIGGWPTTSTGCLCVTRARLAQIRCDLDRAATRLACSTCAPIG